MARPKKSEYIPEESETSEISPSDQLTAFLDDKENLKDHFNYEDTVNYKLSMGSLNLDMIVGGIGPGVHRFCGSKETGKTSEALEVMRQFFLALPDGRGIYIKCEGRLSENIIARTGIEFVLSGKEWKDGNCFVYESNVFESVYSMIKNLITNNPTKRKYFIIIDSLDTMIRRADIIKPFGDANMVSGGANITSVLFKHLALPINKFGHIVIMMSQKRADIAIGKAAYGPAKEPYSGGNALLHQANFTLEFQPRSLGAYILFHPPAKGEDGKQSESSRPTKENPAVGHVCKVRIGKSTNETTDMEIKYPIRYHQVGGKSIWVEHEIAEQLIMNGLIEKKGSWFILTKIIPLLVEKVGENHGFPERVQGELSLKKLIGENEAVKNILYAYLQSALQKNW